MERRQVSMQHDLPVPVDVIAVVVRRHMKIVGETRTMYT